MIGTLLPYLLFAMLMLGFVAYDRWRRRNQFHLPPRNYSSNSGGSDMSPSVGFWGGDSGSSWSGDSGCGSGGDSGGSCGGGDGGGGGGGD
jgi:hypothetical protein